MKHKVFNTAQRNFRIALSFSLLVNIAYISNAQQDMKANDASKIALHTILFDKVTNSIPPIAKISLENKLSQIATQNGMGGFSTTPRFFITANISLSSKDITPTAPPMTAVVLDITYYIGDFESKTKIGSFSQSLKGVGTNENKAWMEAIKQINPNTPAVKQFVEMSKGKIVELYANQCSTLMTQVQSLTSQSQFEKALGLLYSVPDVSTDCYTSCMQAVPAIYAQYANKQASTLLTQMRITWYADQTANGAAKVNELVGKIDPSADLFPKVLELEDSIVKKLQLAPASVFTNPVAATTPTNADAVKQKLPEIVSSLPAINLTIELQKSNNKDWLF